MTASGQLPALSGTLQPERIGRSFRLEGPPIMWKLKRYRPHNRFLLLGGLGLVVVIAIALWEGAFLGDKNRPSAIRLSLSGTKVSDKELDRVEMPLLQDPIGLLAIVVALMAPVYCAAQVEAIPNFARMVEENGGLGFLKPFHTVADIDQCVADANSWFARIGGRILSYAVLLPMAVAFATVLYWALARFGLLASWNFTTDQSDRDWANAVYDGWWANFHHHRLLAISLWLLGIYLFYFLLKQVWVGFVFNWFARATARHGFGVCAQMRYNADGYWGLRPLRGFMEWTYWSALSDFLLTLGVFIVWLPNGSASVLITLAVAGLTVWVVIAPSRIAHQSAVRAKTRFVDGIVRGRSLPDDGLSKQVDALWATPNLPFRVRNTVTAIVIYLLAPLLLAVVSSLLGK